MINLAGLSLHNWTVRDVVPEDLVPIATQLGCTHICLFAHVPGADAGAAPAYLVRDMSRARLIRAMCDDAGLGIANGEFFRVAPVSDFDAMPHGLDVAAELGASRVTALIEDDDRGRALDGFAHLCGLAAERGLKVGIEFIATTQVKSFRECRSFISESGQYNADIGFDTLHFVRGGGDIGELASAPAGTVGYVQISDGPLISAGIEAYTHEMLNERMDPGAGQFPLEAIVAALPDDVLISVEVPSSSRRKAGMSALDRCRMAVDATRAVLAGRATLDRG